MITEVVFEVGVVGFRTPPIREYSRSRAIALGLMLARKASGRIEVVRVAGDTRDSVMSLAGLECA